MIIIDFVEVYFENKLNVIILYLNNLGGMGLNWVSLCWMSLKRTLFSIW